MKVSRQNGGKRVKWDEKSLAYLKELFVNRGMSREEIAKELGISYQSVKCALSKYNINKETKFIITEGMRQFILEERKNGASIRKLATYYGMTYANFYGHCQRQKVDLYGYDTKTEKRCPTCKRIFKKEHFSVVKEGATKGRRICYCPECVRNNLRERKIEKQIKEMREKIGNQVL